MRLENWNPDLANEAVTKQAMDFLELAAEKIAERARQKVPIGKNRPQYTNGKEWTARQAGALRDTIRVVRLPGDPKLNVRVYAGNGKDVYYAGWVEYGSIHNKTPRQPFLRPALNEAKGFINNLGKD
jgi:HK97 gp10 family phage protein